MKIRGITEEQKKKLDKAQILLAEVQIEMLTEDEAKPKQARTENWRQLYRVRVDLTEAMWSLWSD